jgi:NADH-quinone oxidoreductase subunit I
MFGFLKGLGVTLAQLPKKKVTLQYPDERPKWPERFRGIHKFSPELCIVCNQCARVCPTSCISLSGTRGPDRKLYIDTYDINFEICILCDLCTEVCPTEAIKMTDEFELASYSRDDLYKNMEWLWENWKAHTPETEAQEETKEAAVRTDEQVSAKRQGDSDA